MVKGGITVIVIVSLCFYFCSASTIGSYNRDAARYNSRGLQHWIYPNGKQANNFNLNKFGLGYFNTLLGQGNPFAQPESTANTTQSGNQRIVDGVINALGREYDC